MKTVYCIIVTYNGMEWIDRCIQSLLNSSYKSTIIIIDNGSTDATVGHIQAHYPSVELIESGKNLGYGQGNNIGLKIAFDQGADFIFLLNQDAWVEEDSISKLVAAHTANALYGILSPIHMNGDGSDFDDHFFTYLLRSNIKQLLLDRREQKEIQDTIIDTPFVNAAAWFVSASCLRKTGAFDPIFFHYGEDDNYAQRTHYKGYKMGILPTTKIYHDKSRATGKRKIQKVIRDEWTQFLVYACDINKNNYPQLMIKRSMRHILQLAGACLTFNRQQTFYNFSMAKNIILSFKKVKLSRKVSMSEKITPHL